MPIRVLALSGSLRRGSLNTALLRAAADVAPEGMLLDVRTLVGIPLYDADVEAEGMPAGVTALGDAIGAADAVIIAAPEYNYSLPGVLKNGIDWLSRLASKPFANKPLAIMGTSPGRFGTARMQYQLRHALLFTDARVLTKPEVMLGSAGQLFDAEGRLTDAAAASLIRRQLEALAAAVADVRKLSA